MLRCISDVFWVILCRALLLVALANEGHESLLHVKAHESMKAIEGYEQGQ